LSFTTENEYEHFPSEQHDAENEIEEEASIKKLISGISKFWRKFRHKCAVLCDSSISSALLDGIYYRTLSSPIKVVGVFLLSFSLISLVIGAFIHEGINTSFLLSVNTYEQIIVFIVSLLMLTSSKKIGDLLSSSRLLSGLSIVYSQSGILSANSVGNTSAPAYSTAFFLGILTGLCSFMQPASDVLFFILSLLCVIFIFNRPECGFLIILFVLPLFSTTSIIAFSIITFAALIYKYVRGKRHISFGAAELFLLVASAYMLIKSRYTQFGTSSYESVRNFILVVIVCITTVNLVRSTSMFNKFVKLLLMLSRFYACLILIYYVMCVVFRRPAVDAFISNTLFSGLFEALTDEAFIKSMIILMCPINLSLALGTDRGIQRVETVVTFTVMFLSSVFVADYTFFIILIVSCIIAVSFFYKRLIVFVILSPLMALVAMNTYNLIPKALAVSAYSNEYVASVGAVRDTLFPVIKDNLLTGIGFGAENVTTALGIAFDSSFRIDSLAISLLLNAGLIGILLVAVAITLMLYKCGKAIGETHLISVKAKSLSIGLFTSSLSFVLLSIISNTFLDMRTTILFTIIISLGYSTKRCFEADYIEPGKVR